MFSTGRRQIDSLPVPVPVPELALTGSLTEGNVTRFRVLRVLLPARFPRVASLRIDRPSKPSRLKLILRTMRKLARSGERAPLKTSNRGWVGEIQNSKFKIQN
jgi:hypothetical protein